MSPIALLQLQGFIDNITEGINNFIEDAIKTFLTVLTELTNMLVEIILNTPHPSNADKLYEKPPGALWKTLYEVSVGGSDSILASVILLIVVGWLFTAMFHALTSGIVTRTDMETVNSRVLFLLLFGLWLWWPLWTASAAFVDGFVIGFANLGGSLSQGDLANSMFAQSFSGSVGALGLFGVLLFTLGSGPILGALTVFIARQVMVLAYAPLGLILLALWAFPYGPLQVLSRKSGQYLKKAPAWLLMPIPAAILLKVAKLFISNSSLLGSSSVYEYVVSTLAGFLFIGLAGYIPLKMVNTGAITSAAAGVAISAGSKAVDKSGVMERVSQASGQLTTPGASPGATNSNGPGGGNGPSSGNGPGGRETPGMAEAYQGIGGAAVSELSTAAQTIADKRFATDRDVNGRDKVNLNRGLNNMARAGNAGMIVGTTAAGLAGRTVKAGYSSMTSDEESETLYEDPEEQKLGAESAVQDDTVTASTGLDAFGVEGVEDDTEDEDVSNVVMPDSRNPDGEVDRLVGENWERAGFEDSDVKKPLIAQRWRNAVGDIRADADTRWDRSGFEDADVEVPYDAGERASSEEPFEYYNTDGEFEEFDEADVEVPYDAGERASSEEPFEYYNTNGEFKEFDPSDPEIAEFNPFEVINNEEEFGVETPDKSVGFEFVETDTLEKSSEAVAEEFNEALQEIFTGNAADGNFEIDSDNTFDEVITDIRENMDEIDRSEMETIVEDMGEDFQHAADDMADALEEFGDIEVLMPDASEDSESASTPTDSDGDEPTIQPIDLSADDVPGGMGSRTMNTRDKTRDAVGADGIFGQPPEDDGEEDETAFTFGEEEIVEEDE